MTTDQSDLQAELDRLRAENEQLRAASAIAPEDGREERSGVWRAWISAICLVLAGILVPVSIVGTWARVQLVDESAFVATFAPLADDPDVQALVISEASDAVDEAVDVDRVTGDVIAGLENLDLPPAAIAALRLLREPAADGLRTLIDRAITGVVESDAFSEVWQRALIASHRSLVALAANDDTSTVFVDDEGQLGIQLAPIIEELKTELVARGFGLADAIPVIDRTIVIAQADALLAITAVYNLAATVGWWLPVIALVFIAAGILVARRRSTATLGAGLAIAIGSTVLAIALTAAGAVIGLNAGTIGVPARTLDTIYDTVVGGMRDTAVVFIVLGLVIAIAAWFGGRWSGARRTRELGSSLTSDARERLQARGLNTGGFGAWLHRQRVLVRVLLLAAAIVALFLLRPLSIGDVLWTLVIALVVWLVLALLERDPGIEAAPGGVGMDFPDAGEPIAVAVDETSADADALPLPDADRGDESRAPV